MSAKSKPPPRPPAPRVSSPLTKDGLGGMSIHFDHHPHSLDDDSYDDTDHLGDTIQFRKSQSDYAVSSKSSRTEKMVPTQACTDPLLYTDGSAASSVESSPKRTPSVDSGSSLSSVPNSPIRTTVPSSPSKATSKSDNTNKKEANNGIKEMVTIKKSSKDSKVDEFDRIRGFVKVHEEALIGGTDNRDDWCSLGSEGSDPLTVLSQQRDNSSDEDIDVVTKHLKPKMYVDSALVIDDVKNRSNSFKIVDNFYETVDDLDGTLTSRLSQKSPAGVDQSKVIAVPSNSKGLVKRLKRKAKRQAVDKVSPVSFSSLSNEKESEDDDDVYTDSEAGVNMTRELANEKPGQRSSVELTNEKLGQRSSVDHAVIESALPSLPLKRLFLSTCLVFLYYILPLPSYISGMVMGAIISVLVLRFHLWLTEPPPPAVPVVLPDLDELPELLIPEMRESRNDGGIFKGWMNQLPHQYDPDDYHINQTHSIYVRLEGTILRLQQPKVNIAKRAMWNEDMPGHNPTYISQRIEDLTGARVFLQPPELVKRRVWSKKYPICIALKNAEKQQMTRKPSSSSLTSSAGVVSQTGSSTPEGAVVEDGFDVISKDSCGTGIIYLFSRTGREKEEWYRRFEAAARGTPLCTNVAELRRLAEFKPPKKQEPGAALKKHRRQGSTDSMSSVSSVEQEPEAENILVSYMRYLGKIMPEDEPRKATSPTSPKKDILSSNKHIACDSSMLWANALIGRVLWDFLQEKSWSDKMLEKIQKKLDKIHVPYFIDALTITHLDLGESLPMIRRTSKPFIDERGLWIDVDIAYSGGLKMVLETKMNLMKLKKKPAPKELKEGKAFETKKTSPITNSDEEDSAESSTDEETEVIESPEVDKTTDNAAASSQGGGAGKKILKFLDKIRESRYFQKATEYKYIKKAMEGVSNTQLKLSVEVKSLVGTLAVNIPAPPTDRIWYGFRTNPTLSLSATPRVGEREVNYHHITEWIEKKLSVEFQKVFVLPNMDDIVLPIMASKMPENQV